MSKLFRKTHDPIWHLQLAIVVVIALQVMTAPSLLPYNKYVLIGLELLLMGALFVVTPDAYHRVSRVRRGIAITLIAVVTAANIVSLLLLLNALVNGSRHIDGSALLLNGVAIYAANILMFALWYWEMDGGGPDRRAAYTPTKVDFVFTQMLHPKFANTKWLPGFSDYLYLSSTNVTNFAAADTLPVSHRAKIMMMVQALVAVITVVLVAARAINIMQ